MTVRGYSLRTVFCSLGLVLREPGSRRPRTKTDLGVSERSAERWYGAVHGETTEAIADFDDRIGAEAVTQPATGETRNLN